MSAYDELVARLASRSQTELRILDEIAHALDGLVYAEAHMCDDPQTDETRQGQALLESVPKYLSELKNQWIAFGLAQREVEGVLDDRRRAFDDAAGE